MAGSARMEFKLGDGQTHYFQIPTTDWSAGGTLWFTAKPAVDADATDAAAVINKSFTDASIVASTHAEYLDGYSTYELVFSPGDITGVSFSDGSKKKTYLGEFQFVPATGDPESFPNDDGFISVVIFADIKRGTA